MHENTFLLDFRIDWGYQYLYSRRHYHPEYLWHGNLACEGGEILESYKLDYPVVWYGPGLSAIETPLDKPEWESRTKRGIAGARFVARVTEDAVFTLTTVSGTFTFTAKDVLEKGRIEFPVGPKYLQCGVIVTRTNFYWFRPEPKADAVLFNEDQLGLPMHIWGRTRLAYLAPGEKVAMKLSVPASQADYSETLMHLIAMAAPEYKIPETPVDEYIPMELFCDGKSVLKFRHFYRKHDAVIQILDDVWRRFQIEPGEHVIELQNHHEWANLAISRISFTQKEKTHAQLSIPEWALRGEKVTGAVFAARDGQITVTTPAGDITVDCVVGWNNFPVRIEEPGVASFSTAAGSATIEILDFEEEAIPVKVGYDMTQIAHDDTGEMDWLLNYTHRTRLGNYVLFRSFTGPVPDELNEKWGRYCEENGLYVSASEYFMSGALVKGAGSMFHDCGRHEYSGMVYAHDPKPHMTCDDMKKATEAYQEYMKQEIDLVHTVSPSVAFGDASGAIRHAFISGADFIRAETMVGHTMVLLSQARPAAEALGKGTWGVHIAIQHSKEPYYETHLGEYFLSVMQPWMMGAETIYEEDSLFGMWSEERMCWDDALTKGKRDMTRNFFRFAKTHPRKGKNVRNIAFLEGRYAAPFNGFICDVEQDPHYSVWGAFGCNNPEWGHGQPEKCRQLLDVLMPGASTHPLRQKFDKRRFYFAGTPYGDFDCLPVEAKQDYVNQYDLLLNLGWNTMIEEDYTKLTDYVKNGGTLLTGIPQFSTHTRREFLKDMKDLALWKGGDLSDLCGIRVNGAGVKYCGQWNALNKETVPAPVLSALPSDSPDEDGDALLADVTLAGAEIVAWDAVTGKPMLVRNKVGKGWVYTFTLWAYPGHEDFQNFCAAWIADLAQKAQPAVHVDDPSGEVFWTRWIDGEDTIVMLLNTDWTKRGNEKPVTLCTPDAAYPVSVREREAQIIRIKKDGLETETVTL
ncbi:MAG: hypothetical protein E7335_01275 [Clostridiales bacterium]|nr:hypothetical protein [Clostridiales bacterium]